MGISIGRIKLIAEYIKHYNLETDTAVTYGVQGIRGSSKEVINILNKCNIDTSKYTDKECNNQNAILDMLGFKTIDSVDYYPDENPTLQLDLNKPIPSNLKSKYNFLYDGGTTEHCFNVTQVLENTVSFLKVGGVVIHCLPMSGFINHGFYQFSPTLFYDFYSQNGFSNFKMDIFLYENRKDYIYSIDPNTDMTAELVGIEADIPNDFCGKTMLVHFSAQKVEEKKEITYPIQSAYRNKFGDTTRIEAQKSIKFKQLKQFLYKLSPSLYNCLKVKFRLKEIKY